MSVDIHAREINHPSHYTKYDVEAIELTEYFSGAISNALKYTLRYPDKAQGVVDLKKALWYTKRALAVPVATRLSETTKAEIKNKFYRIQNQLDSKIGRIVEDLIIAGLYGVNSKSRTRLLEDAAAYLEGMIKDV